MIANPDKLKGVITYHLSCLLAGPVAVQSKSNQIKCQIDWVNISHVPQLCVLLLLQMLGLSRKQKGCCTEICNRGFLGKCIFSLSAFLERGSGKMQILARKLKFFVDDFPYMGNLLMVIKQ